MYLPSQTPKVYSDTYLNTELQKIRQELDQLRKYTGDNIGQGYVFDDYVTSGLAVVGGASAPSLATFIGNIKLYEFPGTGPTTKDVLTTTHILHGIKPGSDITLHVHFSTNQTATANSTIVWNAEWSIARGYGAGTYGNPSSPSVSCGTMSATCTVSTSPYVHHISGDDKMKVASNVELEPDSVFLIRLYRDPTHTADTADINCYLIQMDWHYERDRIGTTERNRVFGSWR